MNLFRKLIERNEEDFSFFTVSLKNVYKIINHLRPTKARGENEITNLMIKQIPQYVALAINTYSTAW